VNQTQAIIERVRRVSETHQRLSLAVEPSVLGIKPGQSLLVRAGVGWEPYLRQQWHPVGLERDLLVVERPVSDSWQPGTVVDVIAPIGSPFRFRKTLHSILMLAYNTAPTPLLHALLPLLANRVSVTLLLLGTARGYDTAHLPPEVEVVRGEDDGLNWQNRVTTVGWADQVMVLTAPEREADDLRAVWLLFRELRADIPANTLFAVHSPALPCGVGACGACAVRQTGGGMALACTEGPALDMTRLAFDAQPVRP
jgi:hypothetical protein